ncbi:MAG: uroporphyrinogen-III synthase [Paludibacteraceae bacterium]|nr:uroporphyrinogen-III synthase [Paludibacteraceae bacterium]MBN2788315.1 uroporphyrinogen-III synthase [Paludibacteraceae bacterium]
MKIKKILISQPKPTAEKSPYFDIIQKYGVKIDFRPFIKVEPVSAKDFRQEKVSILDHSAIIFTARTGIDNFFRLCQEMRITVPEDMKYFCISETVALYLQKYTQYRKRKVFYGTSGKLPELITVMQKHNKENYLLACTDVCNDDITNLLDNYHFIYKKGIMYRTVSNDFSIEEEFDYDMLIFFSPSGVASLLKNFPDFKQENIKIGCFGKNTALAVEEAGLTLDLEVPQPKFSSMTTALDFYIKENHKNCKK